MKLRADYQSFCGKGFVIFNNQSEARQIVKQFQTSLFQRALNFVVHDILGKKTSNIIKRSWDHNLLYVERAPEPGDIYWENLGVSTKKRLKKILWTYFIAAICLAIAFGLNYGIRKIKKIINTQGKEGTLDDYIIRSLSIAGSLVVAAINTILGRVIRALTFYEKHETYTKYHISVSFKLTIAMFINTVIIPLIVNFGRAIINKY